MAEAGYAPLLVTCPGAYADSGLGTGGTVLFHKGGAHVIDRLDTTGLWESDGILYRFARGLHTLAGIDRNGLRVILRLPEARDVHDIAVRGNEIVAVCSGSNEVLRFDAHGRLIDRWAVPGEGDAWHLNCLWYVDGRMYLSAFGEFATHRGWTTGCRETGFIFERESGKKVMEGLSGPHNPRFIDGAWYVCDSHARSLRIQDAGGRRRVVELGAFTRGLAFDERHLYVGESADRKAAEPSTASTIAVLDRVTLKVLDRLTIPFAEIYEILPMTAELADAIAADPARFSLDTGSEREMVVADQVRRGEAEVAALRSDLARFRNSRLCRNWVRLWGRGKG